MKKNTIFKSNFIVAMSMFLLMEILFCDLEAENMCSNDVRAEIWNKDQLYKAPKSWPAKELQVPGVKSLFYEGLKYKGGQTKVYAYYGVPEGEAPAGGWPAIVLVHGGGGTAYPQYVKWWNQHGYAAISMDLEGRLPGQAGGPVFDEGGPSRNNMFGDIDKPLDEQWFYHCIPQVILAHSLIRSFPEVNPQKTGLIGVSWGGVITCLVVGVDDRFKFAIPVYGCAALVGSDGTFGMERLNQEQLKRFMELWEGSAYLARSRVPMLWANGTNDINFPLDSWQKSINTAKGPGRQRAEIRMPHGHNGFMSKEAVAFADEITENTVSLPEIGEIERVGDKVSAEVVGNKEIIKAELCYTLYGGKRSNRIWESGPAIVSGKTVTAVLPKNTTAFYFNITNERGLMLSSKYVETGATGELVPVLIETESFEKWVLVDLAQRGDGGKYLEVSGKTVSLMAADKAVQYLYMSAIPALNGGRVEFSFKAEGSGRGQIGFIAYADEKWTQTDGHAFQSFLSETASKDYKFTLPIKGEKIKVIRVLIGAEQNSKVKFSDLKINIKQ
jgi:dienelactone hydrolase